MSVFSSESLGIFECYDVWTHQSWMNSNQPSGSQNNGSSSSQQSNMNPEKIDEEGDDQISITSNDSYTESLKNFFYNLKDATFGSSSKLPNFKGAYQKVASYDLEKF